MEITFKSKKLEKQLTKPKEIQKAYGKLARKINQRMADFRAAANLNVILNIPGARLHGLSGSRNDEYAVDISTNYRIILKIDQDPIPKLDDGGVDLSSVTNIKIVEIEDYH
jgi:plasmid maintenance system killer protein